LNPSNEDLMKLQSDNVPRQGVPRNTRRDRSLEARKGRPKQANRQETPGASPSWKQQAPPPDLNPSNEGLMKLRSDNVPWQGVPPNTRRDRSLEARKAHTARRALEGRQWQPRLRNEEDRDKVATVPKPSPLRRGDSLENIRHEDTIHSNPRLAAREQNVRFAKGLLQDSIQALQEDEQKEQQSARRTALEQDMNFAEDCQNLLLPTNRSSRAAQAPAMTTATSAAPAEVSNALQRPVPGGSTQTAESAKAKQAWDSYVQEKPYLPEWAAWWEPQAPVAKEHPSDLVMKSVQTKKNATTGGCFSFRASSKGAEARRQERLMMENIKL